MSWVAAAIAGSAVIGGVVQSSDAQNAASQASQAANSANQLQTSEFNQVQNNEAPYRAAGAAALSQMQNPAFQQGFTQADFTSSPGYQFALQQGNNALQASQAAQGNNVSGAGLAALDQYNQGMANQDYQQAFNNFNQTQNQNYSRLSTLANLGAGGNAQQNASGQNYANNSGQNILAAGNAQAQASAVQGNAITNSINGLSNAYGNYANQGAAALNNPANGGGNQANIVPGSTPSVYNSGGQTAYDPYSPTMSGFANPSAAAE